MLEDILRGSCYWFFDFGKPELASSTTTEPQTPDLLICPLMEELLLVFKFEQDHDKGTFPFELLFDIFTCDISSTDAFLEVFCDFWKWLRVHNF